MGNSTSLSLGSPRRLSGSAMDALAEYRATTFDGLRECRETLQELGKEELDEEDFDLVFSLTLADPAEHFKYWKLEPSRAERRWQRAARVAKATSRWKRAAARRPKALADAEASPRRGRLRAKRRRKDVARSMEIFCALYLLCDEACLDAKVAAIHALFDGDGDGYVSASECSRLLVCCFQGLNRATRTTPVVSAATVAALADDVGGDRVSASQLRSFVATRLAEHLAPFLPGQDKGDSTFLPARMVHAYHRRREELCDRALADFLLRSGPARVVDLDVFRGIVRRLPGFPSRGDVDAFAALLDANGGAADGLIGLDEFGDAVAAWVAFAVVDDDASGSLSAAELKFLLWVQAGDDGAEPGAHAVGRALAAMDADASGEIDRLEWLRYAACRDPVTGAARFSRADRAEFEANDRDGSADVSVREVRATFHKNAKDALARLELTEGVFSVETFELLNSLVRAAGDEIMHLVDKDRDGVISFSEYTAAKPIIKQKHDEILNYATVVVRHQHKDPAACARGRRRKAAGTRLSNVALLQSGSSEEF
ncbi:hypothetical protein SO694_00026258 [Aureococcus anophagefferens]|uniref:EF-hand domain-containing protein n=1 Tax=Aureococcus anophagefferens TaxID=44056 RepID=A0ABR1FUF4_AURAN